MNPTALRCGLRGSGCSVQGLRVDLALLSSPRGRGGVGINPEHCRATRLGHVGERMLDQLVHVALGHTAGVQLAHANVDLDLGLGVLGPSLRLRA